MKHPVHTKFVIANLLFLRQDQIRAALAQPVAAGRLDRVLEQQLTLGTEVLLPVVRLEDSFVHLVPRHLVSYAEFARKDNWAVVDCPSCQ